MQGGRDHLSHRFVALGCSPGLAVAILVSAQGALSALAVAAGWGAMLPGAAVTLGLAILAAVTWFASKASVYDEVPTPISSWEPRPVDPLPVPIVVPAGAAVLAPIPPVGVVREE
jgi:hypothetical protein